MNWDAKGIDLKQVRGGKTFCPACHSGRKNKHDRSLSVDINAGLYNCHNTGCNFSGTVAEGDFLQMVKAAKTYTQPLERLQNVGDKALKWFEDRGISNNTLLRFKVTESVEWMPGDTDGKKSSVICFNYYRDEKLVNIKHRTGNKRFRMEKGAELIFYNLDACKHYKDIVIVEGEIDALSLWEAGIYNVVSVPNGASISVNAKLEYLDNCWAEFDSLESIILATDNDEAGKSLSLELSRRLGANKCLNVTFPDGCKDANDVLKKLGAEVLKGIIENAEPIPLAGVATVLDEMDGLISLYKNGYPDTVSVDWGTDEFIKWRAGQLVVITGVPGSGKSTWLNGLLERLASKHGWRAAIFSPEKNPVSFLIAELAGIHAGKPYYKANPDLKMSPLEWENSLNFVGDHFYFLRIGEVDMSVDGLLEKAAECVKRYGIKSFVIDPWNYLEHQRDKGLSETEYIAKVLTRMAAFCKKYSCSIFLIAHPTKMPKDSVTGQTQIPTLYNISGSANFFNIIDVGITIYRNNKESCTEVHIQKVRWFFDGTQGMAHTFYQPNSQRFEDTPYCPPFIHEAAPLDPFAGMKKAPKVEVQQIEFDEPEPEPF